MDENKPKRGRPKKIIAESSIVIPSIAQSADTSKPESDEHRRVRLIYERYAQEKPEKWARKKDALLAVLSKL